VVGKVGIAHIQSLLESRCGVETITVDAPTGSLPTSYSKRPQAIRVNFLAPPPDARREQQIVDNDAFLATIIDLLPSSNYTAIFITTPVDPSLSIGLDSQLYEMDADIYQNPIHLEMKRDFLSHSPRGDKGDSNLPLFEKYQFLSPGIFMGLMAGFFFLLVVYVGIYALGSLKVSYAAFEKDNSPSSVKKQQ